MSMRRGEPAGWERHYWRYAAVVGGLVGLIDGGAQLLAYHRPLVTSVAAGLEGGTPWFLIWGLFGWWRARRRGE